MLKLSYIYLFGFSILFAWESSKVFIPNHNSINDMNIYSGLDILQSSKFNLLKNKSIGLVINHTSVNRYNSHFLELIQNKPNIEILKLFTPEHGLKGKLSAGEFVNSSVNTKSEIEIISLYGKNKKPTHEDLNGIDLMVYDIQDIGSRYYTYISTMTYIMEACAENDIPVIILDRPNPLGGKIIRGPILKENFKSFVGMHPIPIIHGMTSGELGIMINEQNWINSKVDLTVIPTINWQRKDEYNGSLKGWIPPSPNIPNLETAKIYTGFCLLEGTNISEGRGTYEPFKFIGAPWMNNNSLTLNINQLENTGLLLKKTEFNPISINDMAKWPKYKDKNCNGYQIMVNNENIDPLTAAIKFIYLINKNYPNNFEFLENNFIDLLYGSDDLRNTILNNENLNKLYSTWIHDEEVFRKQRSKYLIYN